MEINLNIAARILLFIPTISMSILAQAQVEDEDMLFYDMPSVFTASKYEQKISEAPARISVITAEEIQRYGYRSLTEALQSLPGIQLSYDHTYSYLGVRGLNVPGDFNTRVLVLIDGHRTNENMYDGVLIDQGNIISIDMIKQIEMIRGPASSLYGSNAVLGVINIITKDGRDLNGSQISVDTGSHDTHQGRISYGKQYGSGVELLVSASLYRSEGDDRYFAEYDDPATNNGVAEEADDSNNDSLLVKLSYGDFALSTVYAEYEKVFPTAAYETLFNDNHTVSIEGRSYINLEYQTLLADSMEVSGKLYYDKYWYDGDYFYDGEGDPNYVYKDKNQGEWWGVEGQLSKVLFDSHRLTSGLEYRQTFTAEQEAFDVYENYLDIDTRQETFGLYIQDEWQVNEQWTFSLGLRFDDYSTSDSSVNPRFAGIWHDNKTTVKLLYGTAFRAPNAYELFYDDGTAQKANSMLDPETIESYEVIWEQQLNSSFRLIASIYRNTIDDMLVLVTDPSDGFEVFANEASVESDGMELELLANFSNGWSGSLSYAYQESKNGDGDELVNYAPNMIKLNAMSPLIAECLLLGLELQYEDSRKTLAGSATDAYTLANLNVLNNTLADELTLSAGVYNLFDETYSHPGFQEHTQNELPQNGRTFRVRATYLF